MPPCPTCGRPAAPRQQNLAAPFCKPRCKLIDLGKWLKEEYRVPLPDGAKPDDESPSTAAHPNQEQA